MATIVKLRNSKLHAVLVGTGYGMFKSARPSAIFGEIFSNEKKGEISMAAVSAANGKILWCRTDDLEVVSVDGESPAELLKPYSSS